MPLALLLTVEEAAEQLQIARRRVYEMIGSGELPSVKIGKSRRIRSSDLIEYVNGLTDVGIESGGQLSRS